MPTKTNSKFPITQIQCVNLRDLFNDDSIFEAVTLKLIEVYPEEMEFVKDETIWSAKGFLRFINHWINSGYYHLADSSFIDITKLWTSAWRLKNSDIRFDNPSCAREFHERMDSEELQREIADYKVICKVRDFLSNHPDCYVYNDFSSSSKPNSKLLYNIDVVSIDDICDFEWEVAFEEHFNGHNLCVSADQVIHCMEQWIEYNGEGDQDEYVINFRKTIKKLKKNPSVFVTMKDHWHMPRTNDPYWDWT